MSTHGGARPQGTHDKHYLPCRHAGGFKQSLFAVYSQQSNRGKNQQQNSAMMPPKMLKLACDKFHSCHGWPKKAVQHESYEHQLLCRAVQSTSSHDHKVGIMSMIRCEHGQSTRLNDGHQMATYDRLSGGNKPRVATRHASASSFMAVGLSKQPRTASSSSSALRAYEYRHTANIMIMICRRQGIKHTGAVTQNAS